MKNENIIQKGKIKIKQKYFILYLQFIIVLLKIDFISLVILKDSRKLNNYDSEIKLVIKVSGQGNMPFFINILNYYFYTEPFEVKVNGAKKENCKKTCELKKGIYNITLIFKDQIKSCFSMFSDVKGIIEVDLSEFDVSRVVDMSYMFANCNKLRTINFGNINTSSVKNMEGLFAYCTSLTSIDLSNFDTSNVETMEAMFYYCYNLKYLDLSNFITPKVTTIYEMFYYCSSLIYLNLFQFQMNSSVNKSYAFDWISENVKYCINDTETKNYLLGINTISICSDTCYNENNLKIDKINNICVESCLNKGYEYNSICDEKCPKGTLINGNLCEDNKCVRNEDYYCSFYFDYYCQHSIYYYCHYHDPEGYYFDSEDEIYKKCYENCKICNGKGNETINNCIECKYDYKFLNETKYKTNCYEECGFDYNNYRYYYYFNESNEYSCTEELKCPDKYNILIRDKNKCIDECKNDDIYKYEYKNNCYTKCPNETYILEDKSDYLCFDKAPDGYYLDKENNTFKKCYESCFKCDIGGNEQINNCKECKENYTFYNNSINISNCYPKCNNYYYFDESNNFHCNETCPEKYKLIMNKSKCIDDCKKDDIYQYEYNNICYEECPNGTYKLVDDNYICYDEAPSSYYLNLEEKLYKKCYETCNKCIKGGSKNENNCEECIFNFDFYYNLNNISNCYPKCNNYYYFDESNNFHCNETCPEKYKLIMNKTKCIDDCKKDDTYQYEYNNTCYDECPNDTYLLENNDYICYDKAPNGYYLDKENENEIYKKCYESCNQCETGGNETNHNCLQCKSDYDFYINPINISNCYPKCNNYYYFDESNNFHCNETCPEEYNKLILNKSKCIDDCKNDDTYKYEYNNTCYNMCPNETYLLEDNDYKCYNETPNSYYFDKHNNLYRKCFETCKECDFGGNETNNNCKECKANYTFYDNPFNISNCYPICEHYYYFDKLNNYHCNETCPEEYNILVLNKSKCIDNCQNDDIYQYEYNNTCLKECPNGNYIKEDDEYYYCYDETPEQYYLDKENKILKKCYESCNICDKGGNETYHNCKECLEDYEFYNNSMNISNCYPKCNYYYYFDESNNFHCNQTCPEEYKKFIKEKKKCVNNCKKDNIYKYDHNNICLKECPIGTFQNETDYICYELKNIETTIINEFNNISTSKIEDERDKEIENFRGMISDFNVSENKEDIITTKDNVQYQMTTSDNQKNNTNKNMSTIDLGDCEDKLKTIYGIDKSLPLIIFKIDYFPPDSSIPIIGYEIYHPLNKSKLDLKYCEDILIKLNIPVTIDEDNLFKYDPNSEFYNDNCFSYTTENGTDIILNDRKQEFTDNKLSLCENNCNYTGYDGENKQSSCDCNIKNKMDTISELLNKPIELSNNFETEESSSSSSSNIVSIKCTKALFSKEGLKNNISSYILLIFIGQFLLSIILFMKCGYPLLVNTMNEIIKEKEKIKKQMANNNQITTGKKTGIKKKRIKSIKNKMNFPPKKVSLNFVNNMNINKKVKKSSSLLGLNQQSKINKKIRNVNKKNINRNIKSNNNFVKNKNFGNLNTKPKFNNNKNINIKISYNDYELNTFDYRNAVLYDKRSCCQYYLSLLKEKNPIIFSFCPRKDYNSMIIKTCIFSLSFSIYYAANFAFFNDEIMHEIYETGGKYDIMLFIPKIAISFAASYHITTIIKIIFLSERNIVQVRRQLTPSLAYTISDKEKRNLIIKHIIFFVLGLIFLVFFWILLSSFGAVYPNTQMFIFKNTLISFAMSLVYPFFINILPSIFRMCSLRSTNGECAYKISKFLQLL